ncbi:MAG: hypothetical protein ABQ298_14535 [Puniceicoccaceae bacterium]
MPFDEVVVGDERQPLFLKLLSQFVGLKLQRETLIPAVVFYDLLPLIGTPNIHKREVTEVIPINPKLELIGDALDIVVLEVSTFHEDEDSAHVHDELVRKPELVSFLVGGRKQGNWTVKTETGIPAVFEKKHEFGVHDAQHEY